MQITLFVNGRLQPQHRLHMYEKPLAAFLSSIGAKIKGAGSKFARSGEIESCDIVIRAVPEQQAQLMQFLDGLGLPKGSLLIVDQQRLPIGRLEGLGLYLNGTALAASVYAEWSPKALWEAIDTVLGSKGRVYSYWEGPTETALSIYGGSFQDMHAELSPLLQSHPLCQHSRIAQIA